MHWDAKELICHARMKANGKAASPLAHLYIHWAAHTGGDDAAFMQHVFNHSDR